MTCPICGVYAGFPNCYCFEAQPYYAELRILRRQIHGSPLKPAPYTPELVSEAVRRVKARTETRTETSKALVVSVRKEPNRTETDDRTETSKGGRPKKWASEAERLKYYRDRQKDANP